MPTLKRRPVMATTVPVHFAAPVGGINTVDAGGAMPPTDAVWMYNLIADSFGLRSRLGFNEWVTGLGSAVRTCLPFVGSQVSGSSNKLFAVTSTGIWTASSSTTTPTQLVAFGITSGRAGYGISCVASTPAGRFLLFCDEENGLYVYSENTSLWAKVALGTTELWTLSTTYFVGDRVVNGANVYVVTVAGTSAASGGPTGTGAGIVDGTVTWNYVSVKGTNVIGPSLADQRAGFLGDPAKFVFVTVFKSKVWLVEKDSSRAWYLATNAIFGTATSFDMGTKMRAGGPLVGLYNWSYDGGSGMDTLLVGISTAGDIVIYQGTDPTSAATFGLKGCWFVGGVPLGRQIAIDYGGDILVLSLLGILPLSKLVIGNPIVDRSQYATSKISNLFNQLASERRSLSGWALHIHPTDNALLVTVPTQDGQDTEQLAMSFVTRGWSRYRGLPICSASVWDGNLYFGTTDGRVCLNVGYVDNVLLSDPNAYSPVQWSVLTSYQNGGSARMKRIHMIRPSILSESSAPTINAVARFNYDTSEPVPVYGAGLADSGAWDSAIWDQAVWGGNQNPYQPIFGAAGMAREFAIAIQGSATSRTTFVGVDVFADQGGML